MGTASYVDDEITRWMQPELPLAAKVQRNDDAHMIDQALTRLQTVAPHAKSWTVTLPHRALKPRTEQGLSISWEEMPTRGNLSGRRGSENLDALSGTFKQEIEPRSTGGGRTLYRMHYALHYLSGSVGIKIVGICTMLMLLAVVTGVVTHKKIFRDFFTFRPGKGQRSWMDAHNVVSVMSLPFFLMITYTGLVFFAITYLPIGRAVIYDHANLPVRQYSAELREQGGEFVPVATPPVSLAKLVSRVEADWGKGQVASLQLVHPKGQTPYIDVRPVGASGVNNYDPEIARFSALDGTALTYTPRNTTVRTQNTLYALHEGNFASWPLRWMYVISGLLGCAVIGTGLVLWTVKRRTQHQQRVLKHPVDSFTTRLNAGGLRLVEVLNAATIAGLPLGVAGYFWANRLLALNIAERASWEVNTLFLLWGLALLYASIRPLKHAWLTLLYLTAAAYGLIPVLNALTTNRHLAVTLAQGDWGLAGFDLSMLGLAATFFYIAIKLKRKWQAVEVNRPTTRPAQRLEHADAVALTGLRPMDAVEGAQP